MGELWGARGLGKTCRVTESGPVEGGKPARSPAGVGVCAGRAGGRWQVYQVSLHAQVSSRRPQKDAGHLVPSRRRVGCGGAGQKQEAGPFQVEMPEVRPAGLVWARD